MNQYIIKKVIKKVININQRIYKDKIPSKE